MLFFLSSSAPHRGATLNYRQLLAGASGTSSPSREVADILGGGEGDDDIGELWLTKPLSLSFSSIKLG